MYSKRMPKHLSEKQLLHHQAMRNTQLYDDVFSRLQEQKTVKQITKELGITHQRVYQVKTILRKLGRLPTV